MAFVNIPDTATLQVVGDGTGMSLTKARELIARALSGQNRTRTRSFVIASKSLLSSRP